MRASFRIGPVVVALPADLTLKRSQHETFTPFQTDPDGNQPPDLTIEVHDHPVSRESGLALAGEHEGNWRLFRRRNDGWWLEILDPQTHLLPLQVALISEGFDQVDLYRSSSGGWYLREVMTTFVQWWLTGWLASREQGMILHGCAVAREGIGLAFVGPSGAGKTTLAQLCMDQKVSGWTVLNDERIVIWKEKDGWQVGGTPWSGMLQQVSPVTAPLAGLFTLKKAAENRVVPVLPMRFVTQLVSEAFHPIWSRPATEGLLAAASRLIEQVPIGEFQFLKDPSAVDFLQGFLKDPAVVF